jgi:hypothetical protein
MWQEHIPVKGDATRFAAAGTLENLQTPHLVAVVPPTSQQLATGLLTLPDRQVARPLLLLLPTGTLCCHHHLTGRTGAGVADVWTLVTAGQLLATHIPAQDNTAPHKTATAIAQHN